MDATAEQIEPNRREEGNILVGVLVTIILVLGLIFASTTIATTEISTSRRSLNEIRAYYVAQAGIERGINFLKGAVRRTAIADPLLGIRAMFSDGAGGMQDLHPFIGEPVLDASHKAGEFTLTMSPVAVENGVEVTIRSTGYTPWAPHHRPENGVHPVFRAVEVTVRIVDRPSSTFDYGFFVNNWGWLNNGNLSIHGNAGANGPIDAGGATPAITGQPRYEGSQVTLLGVDLLGYRDDNRDGIKDGSDGGIYSAWDITGAAEIGGLGGSEANQHDFVDPIPMPNLTDLSRYESRALASGGSISVGLTTLSDSIYGDNAGETGNLVLYGTALAPIRIDGLVVVRGDVILRGMVTGQGAIYAGGNIYIAGDLRYSNPPLTRRPLDNSQASTEAWILASRASDLVGLFARENITVGNHEDPAWRAIIEPWMADSANQSGDDAGEDHIPNTLAGRDGDVGTIDDDVLEGDLSFVTETYSELDADLGLIPPGHSIGQPVPGSGEDIDGDGVFDRTRTIAEIDFDVPLTSEYWGGNIEAAASAGSGGLLGPLLDPAAAATAGPVVLDYGAFADNAITSIDAAMFTNQAFSMVSGGTTTEINGAIVCRNQQIFYSGSLTINYDARLLGGGGILAEVLPRGVERIQVLSWRSLDADPNHDVLPPPPK